jgi:cyclic pyranopterin phosphate synthase
MKSETHYLSPLEILELFAKNNLSEKFCVVPFSNMIFNPNGDVGICRQKGTKHVVGNITKESIDEIWNSEYLQRWRQEFLTGNIKICEKEIKNDSCHLSPDNYTLFSEIDLTKIQEKSFLKLTANFNGQCNLKCTMCDIWMMQNGLYDEIDFWPKAKTHFFPYIKEVELLSGEPFIQRDTYRLIDEISKVNPEALWSFTTNGHWRFTKSVRDSLDKIKIKNIIVSIDSLNEQTYASIRKEGNLKVVLKNLDDLIQYGKQRADEGRGKLSLCLHFLVMKNNWHELGELVDFVEDKGLLLTINNCYEPKELSLWDYGPKKLEQVAYQLLEMLSDHQLKRVSRALLSIGNDLGAVAQANLLLAIRDRLKSDNLLEK